MTTEMHLEFIVEDQSGARALESLVPKLVSKSSTWNIHAYKGIGRIPSKKVRAGREGYRILLEQLPRLLAGYGRTFEGYGEEYEAHVVVVVDLDDKDEEAFRSELHALLDSCSPAPETSFCIAVEEGEAWLLGDEAALSQAYPSLRLDVLHAYGQDSICGTWEVMADVVFPGGAVALKKTGNPGRAKYEWASEVAPAIDVDSNVSPSFQKFVAAVRAIDGAREPTA